MKRPSSVDRLAHIVNAPKYKSFLGRATNSIELAGLFLALGAMCLLAVRAAVRLELRWDTLSYHLPFAAMRAGMKVPFQLPPLLQGYYQGFPPLPEFLEGVLWRITGSVNATGVLNYLALCTFLFFVWRILKARLWVVVLLCLTTPLVLIHAASSYVDLFSNALLAIGVSAVAAMLLFHRWMERKLLLWALAGTIGAAWSKFTTMPFVALILIGLLVAYGMYARRPENQRFLMWTLIAAVLAVVPMAKNVVLYRNPIWPIQFNVLGWQAPSLVSGQSLEKDSTPAPLIEAPRPVVFFHSLFEIGHPTSYPHRERWTLDQGNSWLAFRSGGFWVVSVLTTTFAAILLGFLSSPRHGWIVAGLIAGMWGILSVTPGAHELRYVQFLPLTVASIVAMLLPRVHKLYPATTLAIACVLLGEFIWVTRIDRTYYRVERVGLEQAAEMYGMHRYWNEMDPGKTYCAVGFEPATFLLTGPTLHEFRIVGRDEISQCPVGMPVLLR